MTQYYIKRISAILAPRQFAAMLLASLMAGTTSAQLMGFTDRAAYEDKLIELGYKQILIDFENADLETLLPDPFESLSITSDSVAADGGILQAVDVFDQTTPGGSKMLGTSLGDELSFVSFDSVSFEMSTPSLSFGINVIGSPGGIALQNDVLLKVANETIGTIPGSDLDAGAILGDGGEVFFLGFIASDPGDAFSIVELAGYEAGMNNPTGEFAFHVDDISVAPVPLPAPALLLLCALGALATVRAKLSRSV